MYYIVEITPQGIETFLEGFEELGEAWDACLACNARPAGAARFATRFDDCPGRRGDTHVSFSLCCS